MMDIRCACNAFKIVCVTVIVTSLVSRPLKKNKLCKYIYIYIYIHRQINLQHITSHHITSHDIRSDQIRSDHTRSDQTRSDQIRSVRIRSEQIGPDRRLRYKPATVSHLWRMSSESHTESVHSKKSAHHMLQPYTYSARIHISRSTIVKPARPEITPDILYRVSNQFEAMSVRKSKIS